MRQKNTQLHIPHRLAALVLCFLIALTLLPTTAFAAGGSTGALQWQLSGGTLTVSGSGPMPNYTDANMPPWYDSAEAINRIVVKEGVTSVGSLAFYGCSTATGVSLPSTVTSIGDRAFKNCYSLTYVGFPAALTAIGEAAFESCEKLNGIRLPSGLRVLGNYAFNRCTSLSAITIPASVTDFGMVTFAYCTGLLQAVVLCPITKLPDWTFYGCTALATVALPDTVTQSGENAFHACTNLGGVYYSGAASESISEALRQDETTRNAQVFEGGPTTGMSTGGPAVSDGPAASGGPATSDSPAASGGSAIFGGSAISSSSGDFDSGTSIVTSVTTTDNATITKTQETDYTFTVNGEPATLEEVLQSGENADIEATGTSGTTINATIENSEGWDELAETVSNTLDKRGETDSNVKVNVQLPDSSVGGEELSKLAGKDVDLTISTSNGNTWVVDESIQNKNSFGKENYDLDFSVTKLDKNDTDIKSDTVYQVKFASDTDFPATVGINLKVGNARQYATLYEKSLTKVTELQTAMVDENGNAWFSLGNVDAGAKYYVGINVEGVDTANSVIPDSLHEAHGIDYTLTDASGTQYQITGRASRWGITGLQFAIYVAVAIGAVVLLVTLIMVTINKMNQSKAKYAAMAASDAAAEEDDLDEDELRMKIMQEMLDEAKKDGNGTQK